MSSEQAEHGRQTPTRRLFFALCPDEPCRRTLALGMRRALPRGAGRPVPAVNLHLTLVFLGRTEETAMDCVLQAGGRVRAASFQLVLGHVGYWARPRVLWLGPRQTPAALFALVAAVRDSLRTCGLGLTPRPYQAHMTLLRKAQPPRATIHFPPLVWALRRFSLMESVAQDGGVCYQELRSWPLSHADSA